MILFSVALLLLHRGCKCSLCVLQCLLSYQNIFTFYYTICMFFFPFYLDALVPVTLVQLGEPVTFTCVLPKELARKQIHWFKQSPGESLGMVITFNNLVNPVYGADFSASRLQIKEDEGGFNLTILETISGDEGMYHCALVDYFSIRWSASYLLIEGKNDFLFCLCMSVLDIFRRSWIT